MERRDGTGRAALTAIWTALSTAGLFEVLSLLESQDKTVRATSPWQDDPYDVFVSFAIFAVPMLAGVIVLRMFGEARPVDGLLRRQHRHRTVELRAALLAERP
ncbi:hypothetical protein ACWEN3_37590, partial [Streptomyces sp. NPDC004561]